MIYTMMQVCKEADMTYQALKFYCNEGLVPYVKRDHNNRRVFDERDLKWIKDLVCLKRCGMSIQEMKEYLELCLQGPSSIPQRKQMLERKQEALRSTIQQLEESVAYIDWKQTFYDEVLAGKRPYESNLIPGRRPDRICQDGEGPESMKLEKLIQDKGLTGTEAAVLEYIVANLDHVLRDGVRGVARANFTSTSTIMRLAKKMGYGGFVDMCYKLRSLVEMPPKDRAGGSGLSQQLRHRLPAQLQHLHPGQELRPADHPADRTDHLHLWHRLFGHGGRIPLS